MSRCRRRTLLVFGGLALLAALFVPFRSTHVSLNRDTQSNLVWKRTSRGGGYMFLPSYLARLGEQLADTADLEVRDSLRRAVEVRSDRYVLNTKLLAVELAAIAFLAAYDFFFLCRRKRRRDTETTGDFQEGPG